jgi:hypothetical protein
MRGIVHNPDQPSLLDGFNAAAARERAEEGIAIAGANKASLLEFAKKLAVELGRRQRFVTADDVQFALATNPGRPISEEALGSAAGGLFKNKKHWRFAQRYVPSVRENSHGRMLRVWEFIG